MLYLEQNQKAGVKCMDKLKDFLEIAAEIQVIFESDIPWEVKYDLIFSEDFNERLKETGVEINWYDPDGSYRDDISAYFKALENIAGDITKVVIRFDQKNRVGMR